MQYWQQRKGAALICLDEGHVNIISLLDDSIVPLQKMQCLNYRLFVHSVKSLKNIKHLNIIFRIIANINIKVITKIIFNALNF